MKRIVLISIVCLIAFLFQFFLFNLLGPWGTPNFLVLCVVFFDLYWGVRQGLFAAFLGGFFLDIFGLEVIGTHILALMICAYVTIFIRRNLYQPGSYFSRAFVAGGSVLSFGLVLGILRLSNDADFSVSGIFYALVPEVLITAIFANTFFIILKKWADQLS